jgi:flavin reductase (DIM6/NTAB) family NADH-FMN oxidoreductase RutF
VLTVREGEHRHGMSASWVTQVSGTPPLVSLAVDRHHLSHGMIERTQRFVLNVVGEKARHLEDYFHGAPSRADNLDAVAWEDSPNGLPLLLGAMASLECRVEASHPAGDHTLFVATVERVTWRGTDRPLTSEDLEYVYVGEVVKRPG